MFSLTRKNFYVNGFLVKMVFRRKIFSGVKTRCSSFSFPPRGGPSGKRSADRCRWADPGNDHGKIEIYIAADPVFASRLKNFY